MRLLASLLLCLMLVGCGQDYYPSATTGNTLQFFKTTQMQDVDTVKFESILLLEVHNVVRYHTESGDFRVHYTLPNGTIESITIQFFDDTVQWAKK